MSELDLLADKLAARWRAASSHDTDERLTRLEGRMDRVVEMLERLANVDERITEVESSRRADAARDQAWRDSKNNRQDNVWRAIQAFPGVVAICGVIYLIGQQLNPAG